MTTSADWVDPDQRMLLRSPLVNVVWQVRFTAIQDIEDGRLALSVQQALGRDTTLAQITGPQIAFQMVSGSSIRPPEQSVVDSSNQGWRISSNGDATSISLLSTSLAVETTQYRGWSNHFYPWIESAIGALSEHARPGVSLRVGMRYINAVFGSALERESFENASALRDVAAPSLLGLLSDPALGGSIEELQGRHLLRIGDQLSRVQHGLVTAESGELGLLLDIDSYIERTAAFDPKDVLDMSNNLHLTGLAVFQRCLTDEAWAAMGPTEGTE